MSRLPPIVIQGRPCALPLSEPTASVLLWTLLARDDTHDRINEPPTESTTLAALTEALTLDPALALWAAIHHARAEHSPGSEPPSIVTLSTFLVDNLGKILSAEPIHAEEAPAAETAQGSQALAELAAKSVLTAQRAIPNSNSPADASSAKYLVELLADAGEWMAPGEMNPPLIESLPKWIGQSSLAVPTPAPSPAATRKGAKKSDARPTDRARGNAADAPQHDRAKAAADRWLVPAGIASHQFTTLAARLIRLADLEANFAERLLEEKLHALGEFAAGAGHEINNPLAVISGRAQLFLRQETDPERRRELAVINTQARRVHEMIADLMLFARPPQPRPAPCDAPSLANSVIAELSQRAMARDIALRTTSSADPLPPISADATQIQVALRAVIENALEAAPDGGAIDVAIEVRASQPRADKTGGTERASISVGQVTTDQLLAITVRDNGPGIDAAGRRNLFDPFYSGRGAGRGVGMGLSKCWRIVTAHGGRVEVENPPSGGACVTILLPLAAV